MQTRVRNTRKMVAATATTQETVPIKDNSATSSTFNNPSLEQEEFEDTPLWVKVWTLVAFGILNIFGHLRDFMRRHGLETSVIPKEYEKMKVVIIISLT